MAIPFRFVDFSTKKCTYPYAKTLDINALVNPHTYLYVCISAFAKLRESQDIGIIASLDIQYRAFVISILQHAIEQELDNYAEYATHHLSREITLSSPIINTISQ